MKRILLFVIGIDVAGIAWTHVPHADGEVRRVNTRTKEITIKHGPIPHLDMGSMTMAFAVKDAAMLEQVKPGDKVKFIAEKVGNEAVVTKIQVVK